MNKSLLYTIIVLLLTTITGFAQIEAFQDEIQEINGVAYYNNKPFTGTLYSNDEQPVKNECECTLKALYKNGKLHGDKTLWYPSGKLKFKGRYENGKPIGKHIELYESGAVKNEWEYASDGTYTQSGYDEEGNKISESFFDASTGEKTVKLFKNGTIIAEKKYINNQLVSETTYENGKPVIEKIIDGKHEIEKIFDSNGIPEIRKSFLKGTQIKDGKWEVYDEFGNLLVEAVYKNNVLIEKQNYQNGKKHGESYKVNTITGELTKNYYRNGNLIKTVQIPKEYRLPDAINKFANNSDYLVVKYFDAYLNTDKFFLIYYPKVLKSKEKSRLSVNKIIASLSSRVKQVPPDDYKGKYLSGMIEVVNVTTDLKIRKYQWHKTVNGKYTPYKEWGYVYHIIFKINCFDIENNRHESFDYDARNHAYKMSETIKKKFLYPKDKDEAFDMAYQQINIYSPNAFMFPAIAKISKVIKHSKKTIKKVLLDKGYLQFVLKKAIFHYIDEDKHETVPKLIITDVNANSAVAKVRLNGTRLKEYKKTHPEVFVIEKLK